MANNEGRVRPVLRNVSGGLIGDRVKLAFRNRTLQSRNRDFDLELPRRAKDLPLLVLGGHPNGLYEVRITPGRYRAKSTFVNVLAGRDTDLDAVFFIKSSRAEARFPSFRTLSTKEEWSDLFAVLGSSEVGEAEYEGLEPLARATLLNLHAKMQRQTLSGGKSVFSFVQRIARSEGVVRAQADRVFFRSRAALLERTHSNPAFRSVSGALHKSFSEGFELVGSYKTRDAMGNLQLTFARNGKGEIEVDADLDDNQGIKHAFDVLRHRLTGSKTHPFNIHQVLVRFQEIDPGYDLV